MIVPRLRFHQWESGIREVIERLGLDGPRKEEKFSPLHLTGREWAAGSEKRVPLVAAKREGPVKDDVIDGYGYCHNKARYNYREMMPQLINIMSCEA